MDALVLGLIAGITILLLTPGPTAPSPEQIIVVLPPQAPPAQSSGCGLWLIIGMIALLFILTQH